MSIINEARIIIDLPQERIDQLNRIEKMLEMLIVGDPQQLMSGPQVEKLLFCGAGKLRKLREACIIPCVGEGTGIRYRRADVLAYARKEGILFPKEKT